MAASLRSGKESKKNTSKGVAMRRIIVMIVAVLLVALMAQPVTAQGNGPAQLVKAGWLCLPFPSLGGVYCMPPGAFTSSETVTARIFGTLDPNASDAPYLGTALFVRVDLYNGQPCPQMGMDRYIPLDFTGDGETDYYGCWHQ
jgi:hypothetical protein